MSKETNDFGLLQMGPVIELVREAGRRILPYKGNKVCTWKKEDGSTVGQADIESHKFLTRELPGLMIHPRIFVLSEEEDDPEQKKLLLLQKHLWIVDPLDGSSNFYGGYGGSSINLALEQHGELEMGVLHFFDEDMTFFARKGRGTFVFQGEYNPDKTERLRIKPLPRPVDKVRVATPWNCKDLPQAFADLPTEKLPGVSAEKIAMILTGSADLAWMKISIEGAHYGPWDIRPLEILVNEAGGVMADISNKRILRGVRNDQTLPPSVSGHPQTLRALGLLDDQILPTLAHDDGP